jgi:hypothetical protein
VSADNEVAILLAVLQGDHYPCNHDQTGGKCSHLASYSVSTRIDPTDVELGPKPDTEAAGMLWELNKKRSMHPSYRVSYRCKRHAEMVVQSPYVFVEERSFARHIERLDAILHKGDK